MTPERSARTLKALRLAVTLLRDMARHNATGRVACTRVASCLVDASDAIWSDLATRAGVKPPSKGPAGKGVSDQTRAAVVLMLRAFGAGLSPVAADRLLDRWGEWVSSRDNLAHFEALAVACAELTDLLPDDAARIEAACDAVLGSAERGRAA